MHYCVYTVPVLSELNPGCTFQLICFKIHFNIIPMDTPEVLHSFKGLKNTNLIPLN
jgi:hypothetical protein